MVLSNTRDMAQPRSWVDSTGEGTAARGHSGRGDRGPGPIGSQPRGTHSTWRAVVRHRTQSPDLLRTDTGSRIQCNFPGPRVDIMLIIGGYVCAGQGRVSGFTSRRRPDPAARRAAGGAVDDLVELGAGYVLPACRTAVASDTPSRVRTASGRNHQAGTAVRARTPVTTSAAATPRRRRASRHRR